MRLKRREGQNEYGQKELDLLSVGIEELARDSEELLAFRVGSFPLRGVPLNAGKVLHDVHLGCSNAPERKVDENGRALRGEGMYHSLAT